MKTFFFVSCLIVCLGYHEVTAATTGFIRNKDHQLHHDVVIASAIDTTNDHTVDMNSATFHSAERQLKSGKDDKSTKTSKKQKEIKEPKGPKKTKKPKNTKNPKVNKTTAPTEGPTLFNVATLPPTSQGRLERTINRPRCQRNRRKPRNPKNEDTQEQQTYQCTI